MRFVVNRFTLAGAYYRGSKSRETVQKSAKSRNPQQNKVQSRSRNGKTCFLVQSIANYPSTKNRETAKQAPVLCRSYGSYSFSLNELLYRFYPSTECIFLWKCNCHI